MLPFALSRRSPIASRRSLGECSLDYANPNGSQPKKDKPKPVAAAKGATDTREGRGRGRGRGAARGGRPAREKKKTVEELDAEMDDYFPAGDGVDTMVTNGNAAATGVDDTNMVDEML